MKLWLLRSRTLCQDSNHCSIVAKNDHFTLENTIETGQASGMCVVLPRLPAYLGSIIVSKAKQEDEQIFEIVYKKTDLHFNIYFLNGKFNQSYIILPLLIPIRFTVMFLPILSLEVLEAFFLGKKAFLGNE